MLEKIKALVKGKHICVLATVSQAATPHCSLMAYVADKECSEIYMATYSSTLKYKNLVNNPAVSLLIDSREMIPRRKAQALTVNGIFQPIDDKNKKERIRVQVLKQHPHLKDFMDNPDTVLICIKVQSFLLLDGLTNSHFVSLKQI